MKRMQFRHAAVAAACLVVLLSSDLEVAMAQSNVLEEVKVTARRRTESFEDVPITITAFSEQTIKDAGIERPQDFVSLTPNVTLVETQNQGNAFFVVRGISQARNSEPSVSMIVDGVQLTNPAQINQQLFDVQQIEVLKGAQGAVYGRNAIGGAIVVTTKQPGDEFEGRVKVGYDSGPGYRAQVLAGGPLGDSDTLKYQVGASYFDTDGYIRNPYLGEDADPYKDKSARLRLIWEPTNRLRTDARYYISKVETQGFWFNIVGDVNDTSLPVRVNNAGINDRDLSQLSFKVDYDLDLGTLTSITSYDTIEEITTGDAFDFLPIPESFFVRPPAQGGLGLPFDANQSQYYDIDTFSQEVRFTSNADGPVRWIAGVYYVGTNRYVSTGNLADTGNGVHPVYRTPSTDPLNFQLTYLADSQDNDAWAAFGEVAGDVSDKVELSFALRYDSDTRRNTTETPQAFLPANLTDAFTGQVRSHTWDELQPRLSVRYEPTDNVTLYGSVNRGFRSGGFNQTSVGAEAAAAGILGVHDLFDKEVADSVEFGVKSLLADGRVAVNASVFDTTSEGPYFFVFLFQSSTQNLGNLDEVDYQGFDFDVTGRVTDNLQLSFGYGYTDSDITKAEDPTVIGNQAPLVTKNTINAGLQYRKPLGGSNLDFFLRTDYRRMGDTWWDPQNSTVRDPVDLVDARIGVEGDGWSVVAWSRNLTDEKYNAEFSPGGFVFKAPPRTWGIEYTKDF